LINFLNCFTDTLYGQFDVKQLLTTLPLPKRVAIRYFVKYKFSKIALTEAQQRQAKYT